MAVSRCDSPSRPSVRIGSESLWRALREGWINAFPAPEKVVRLISGGASGATTMLSAVPVDAQRGLVDAQINLDPPQRHPDELQRHLDEPQRHLDEPQRRLVEPQRHLD